MKHILICSINDLDRYSALAAEFWTEYKESFPYAERRAGESIRALLDREGSAFYILFFVDESDGGLAAFAVLHSLPTFEYIEYLCVPARRRSGGLGAKVLDEISNLTGKALVLEAEPPFSNDWADRRIAFYRRNGFSLIDTPYIQPPYHDDADSVELRLMVRGDYPMTDSPASDLYRHVYALPSDHPLFLSL
ncbi:GNAT family N-acetyltransferase [Porphyromonas sp.]|uniref:GNAT family N-acetyltransferase n=1 Tax=Porphyromonas sp. TaxID=1924944 RepID=UPI0026DD26E9|nr:GNAT family N-acetyltransferase [Porphyromonas sp.]MDO4771151.1 GNAT family N-acetyltransferase [Porphyromonas sp.]